jgi:anti-anti-sigma factor
VELTVRSDVQYVVVGVNGAIDAQTSLTLRERLLRLLNTEPPRLVLDISGVTEITPAAVGVIAEAHRAARLVGGWLCVVCPEENARSLRADGSLPLVSAFGTVEQALAHQQVAEPVAG